MPDIKLDDLVYDYPGHRALDHVTCTIPHNSVTALVGPNGAGKTTLMRCLVGLDTPLSGQVYIDGQAVASNEREIFRRLGYLHDSFGLYATLTVEQCLRHAAAMRGAGPAEERQWVARAAERLELTGKLQQRAGSLSRGWRQRLGMAQALIHSPDVVVLDEPASGLDPEARMHLSALVRQLQAEGATLIISSHILAELESYSSHMLTLAQGRLVNFTSVTATASQLVTVKVELATAPAPGWPTQPGLRPLTATTADLEVTDTPAALAAALGQLMAAGLPVAQFVAHRETMEARYRRLVNQGDQPEEGA